MDSTKINIKSVLIAVKYEILTARQVYISLVETEDRLRSGKIYADELVLLRILKERVESKSAHIAGEKKKNDARHYDNRVNEKSESFKEIPIEKLKRFIQDNDFEMPKYGTLEQQIGNMFFNKYLKG